MELRNQKPALEVLQKNQTYLEKRSHHMQYPRYQAQHLPIGSGAMESGNKVVVEARLKGAGRHWAIPHVNPMLTLRNIFCSERWQEGWQQITITLRQQQRQRRTQLHQKHKIDSQQTPIQPPIKSKILETPVLPQPIPILPMPSITTLPHNSSIPAPNHPWRRSPIGNAKFLPTTQFSIN